MIDFQQATDASKAVAEAREVLQQRITEAHAVGLRVTCNVTQVFADSAPNIRVECFAQPHMLSQPDAKLPEGLWRMRDKEVPHNIVTVLRCDYRPTTGGEVCTVRTHGGVTYDVLRRELFEAFDIIPAIDTHKHID